MIFGYSRVSSTDQNLDRQITFLRDYAKTNFNVDLIENETLFCDEMSGKNFNRPAWEELIGRLREDDILIVKEMDRLGRNKQMILETLQLLKKKKVKVQILDIPTTLVDLSNYEDGIAKAMMEMINNLLIEVFSTIAEQERIKIRNRQAEGIKEAKKKGKYKGRPSMTADQLPKDFPKLYKQWKDGNITGVQFTKLAELNSRTTLYKYIKIYEESLKSK